MIGESVKLAGNLAIGIYHFHKTNQYRQMVLEAVSVLKQGVLDIANELKTLDKKLTYWELWATVNYPIQRIDTAYDQYKINSIPFDTSAICDDMETAMTQIHQVVCGEVQGFDAGLELYLEALPAPEIDKAYKYFTGMILGTMLKGLGLLGAYDETRFINWMKLILCGQEDASDEYLRQPFFAYEGKICEEVINSLEDESDSYPEIAHNTGFTGMVSYRRRSMALKKIRKMFPFRFPFGF